MDLIDGIGGAFLFSNDPKRLAEWYQVALGIGFSESPEYSSIYKAFKFRDLDNDIEKSVVWAILPAEQDIKDKPRTGQINYRVKSMGLVLEHFQKNGIKVDKAEDFSYGKFAWLTDVDGNKVELFEELS